MKRENSIEDSGFTVKAQVKEEKIVIEGDKNEIEEDEEEEEEEETGPTVRAGPTKVYTPEVDVERFSPKKNRADEYTFHKDCRLICNDIAEEFKEIREANEGLFVKHVTKN